jgi:hypothetical protein
MAIEFIAEEARVIKKEKPKKITQANIKQWEAKLTIAPREKVLDPVFGHTYKTTYHQSKYQYKTFAELQKDIDANLPPLKLQVVVVSESRYDSKGRNLETPVLLHPDFINDKFESATDFLPYFFKVYNDNCNTVIGNKNKVVCTSGRRRSLLDLYRICKFYFPGTTIKEIKEALWYMPVKMNSFICHDIMRRVHRACGRWDGANIIYNINDEYGWDYFCTNVEDSKFFKVSYDVILKEIKKVTTKQRYDVSNIKSIDPGIDWYGVNNDLELAKYNLELK